MRSPMRRWLDQHWHLTFALGVVIVGGAIRIMTDDGDSWGYFETAARGLFGADGLHLFAHHPELQFGPLAVLVAEGFRIVGRAHTVLLVEIALVALLMAPIIFIDRIAIALHVDADRRRWCIALASLVLVPAWLEIAVGTAHLDDGLVLTASLGAVAAVAYRRPVLAGLALGLAIDAKPWAVLFVPVLFALPSGSRRSALVTAALTTAGAWMPFVIADHHTLGAVHFTIRNSQGSALRWLGVHTPRTPSWDRLAQMAGGIAIASVAVVRRRWSAVLLAGVAVRLLLDPGINRYYTVGLIIAALLVDVVQLRSRFPWLAVGAFVLVWVPRGISNVIPPHAQGFLRLAAMVTAIAFALFAPRPRDTTRLVSVPAASPGSPADRTGAHA
jgi:hypothetical protein